ncbi:MAG: NUDIX domain-containing protein [bacterium]
MVKGIDYIGVSAGAMIINDQGQIFLAQRGQKANNERGCWENPGGSVEFGEKLADAVKREIMEEYGAEIEIIKQFPAEDHLIPAEHQHWVATTFLAKFKKGSEPKIMEPDKCSAIGWFDLSALPSPLSIITELDIKHHGKDVSNLVTDFPV